VTLLDARVAGPPQPGVIFSRQLIPA